MSAAPRRSQPLTDSLDECGGGPQTASSHLLLLGAGAPLSGGPPLSEAVKIQALTYKTFQDSRLNQVVRFHCSHRCVTVSGL